MKSSVSIAMIACGTFLMVAPYLYDAFVVARVTSVMQNPSHLLRERPQLLAMACVATGVSMIFFGFIAGKQGSHDDKPFQNPR